MNYLQWMTTETPTKFWHDSAIPSEIDEAIENGALGVTTNPVLTYKTLQAVPEFWQPEVDKIPNDIKPEERAEELLRIVATYAAGKFIDVYHATNGEDGYALGQLNPSICMDSELMIEQGLRYASWAENISVKTPTIKSALPLVEELASRGIALCTTLNFSVSQAMAAGEAYMKGRAKAIAAGIKPKPIFIVQQGGRLDEYLLETAKDNRIDIAPEDVMNAGNAICKKVCRLFKERGIPARVMPAGLRGVHHLTSMVGADVTFSLQARVQRMVIEADPERVCHADEEIDPAIIKRLYKLPEFVRAYEEGGLAPEEFITFGVTQKTASQFLWSGWVPLETYQSTTPSTRWF
jgi:transaldolase